MLNVEDVVKESLPRIHNKPWLAKPTTWFLRNLLHESDIRDFSQRYPELNGIDFVEQVLDYFNFSYAYQQRVGQHSHSRAGRDFCQPPDRFIGRAGAVETGQRSAC